MYKSNQRFIFFYLLVICLFSGIIRSYNAYTKSLYNDELSALVSLQRQSSWHEVVFQKVWVDGHPAGVSLFQYYWMNLVGDNPFLFRLPFVLLGTVAILLVYKAGHIWFGEITGLSVATYLALLEYTSVYGFIARPYAFGLFTVLLLVYYWSLFLKKDNKSYLLFSLLLLASTLSIYAHYFAFQITVLIWITGFFLVKRKGLKLYTLFAIVAGLLFLPHLSITLYHLQVGGLSWLSPPTNDFFWEHIQQLFNHSSFVLYSTFLLIISAIIFYKQKYHKLRWVFLLWFILPIIIGFLKSTYGKPILQHSILIFSFPFLLLFLFSFFENAPLNRYTKIGLVCLAVFLSFNLLFSNSYLNKNYFGVYREIVQELALLKRNFKDDLEIVYETNDSGYVEYYQKQLDCYPFDFTLLHDKADSTLDSVLAHTQTTYFAYGYSNRSKPESALSKIKCHYPLILKKTDYFNAGLLLFGALPDSYLMIAEQKINQEILPYNEFLGKISLHTNELIDSNYLASVTYKKTNLKHLKLVISIEKDGVIAFWDALNLFSNDSTIYLHFNKYNLPEGNLKIYLWNPGKENAYIKKLELFSL